MMLGIYIVVNAKPKKPSWSFEYACAAIKKGACEANLSRIVEGKTYFGNSLYFFANL